MSDRGTPRSWRHMNGYGSHTFLWENAGGDKFWVKYHFKTVQGIENFTDDEAKAMVAEEPDFHIRDLHDAIASGDAPEWRLEMQIMPFADAADYRFNPFDAAVNSYNKDGAMRYRHSGDAPVYAPNSYGGPKADPAFAETAWGVEGGEMVRHAYSKHREDDDFGQAGALWREVLSHSDKEHLVSKVVGHATNAVTPEVQQRVIEYWTQVDSELGARVAQGIRGGGDSAGDGKAATNGGATPVSPSASTGL
jgi:catalase